MEKMKIGGVCLISRGIEVWKISIPRGIGAIKKVSEGGSCNKKRRMLKNAEASQQMRIVEKSAS